METGHNVPSLDNNSDNRLVEFSVGAILYPRKYDVLSMAFLLLNLNVVTNMENRCFTLFAIALIAVVSGVALELYADTTPEQIGPVAGSVSSLTCDFEHTEICFAIHAESFYRKIGSAPWKKIVDFKVSQFVIHPDSDRVYLLERNRQRLWLSLDNGINFHLQSKLPWFGVEPKFVISIFNPARIYYVAGTVVLQSNNNGKNWKRMNVPRTYDFRDLTESSFNSRYLYLSAAERLTEHDYRYYLLLSTDHASSWSVVQSFTNEQCDMQFYPDFSRDSVEVLSYRSCADGIYRLNEDGFQPIGDGGVLQVATTQKGTLYALKEDRLDRCKILKSVNRGKSWFRVKGDVPKLEMSLSHVAPTHQGQILTGTRGGGVYRCGPTGTCRAANLGFQQANFAYPVVNAGNDPKKLLTVVTSAQEYPNGYFLYSSTDSGKHWRDLTISKGMNDSFRTLLVHPNDPDTILIHPGEASSVFTKETTEFYISHDAGEHWIKRNTDFLFNFLAFDPNNSKNILAATLVFDESFVLYRSSNDGATFSRLPKVPLSNVSYIDQIVIDFHDSSTFYLCGYGKRGRGIILKTSDNGRTYQEITLKINMDLLQWLPLPSVGSYLAGDEFGNIFLTIDGALSWQNISRVTEDSFGGPLLYAAEDQAVHLYAVISGNLYESRNQGRTWNDITPAFIADNTEDAITSITDPRKGPIYLSSYSGIYKLQ